MCGVKKNIKVLYASVRKKVPLLQYGYGCSFVAKLSRNKNFFLKKKIFVFFTKYILFAEKKSFYVKQKFYAKKNLLLRKSFFQKKTSYTENICVTNKNIYLFELYNHSAKRIFDHEKHLLKLRGKLHNLVYQVSGVHNLWFFLN